MRGVLCNVPEVTRAILCHRKRRAGAQGGAHQARSGLLPPGRGPRPSVNYTAALASSSDANSPGNLVDEPFSNRVTV